MKCRKENLKGNKYNKLYVISYSHKKIYISPNSFKKYPRYYWNCKCDCGNFVAVLSTRLKNNTTRSCGCLKGKSKIRKHGEASFDNLYHLYKKRALERGLCFKLSKKHFRKLTQQKCHYSKTPPNHLYKLNRISPYIGNGIDRKDNNVGYTVKNSVPCCLICNRAKSSLTYREFKNYIKRIKNG